MKSSERVILPIPSPRFPEGRGLRLYASSPFKIETWVRENRSEMAALLDRFDFLALDQTELLQGMDAIDDKFFPIHVDDPEKHPEARLRKKEPYVTCIRLLDPRRTDATHLVDLSEYATALRAWKSAFIRDSYAFSDAQLVNAFAQRHTDLTRVHWVNPQEGAAPSRKRARWAYNRCVTKHAHLWGEEPNSALLYKGGLVEDPTLGHGRLDTDREYSLGDRMSGTRSSSGLGGKLFSMSA